MKLPATFLSLAALIAAISIIASATRLGTLTRDSEVYTSTDDINAASVTTANGYPVFEIRVPDGFCEVQVRASLTNFEPGFLLKDGDNFVFNYIPTGEEVAARKVYKALGAAHEARWSVANSRWELGYKGLYSNDTATAPWDIPGASLVGDPAGTFAVQKEFFVYAFCSTGIPANPDWGKGAWDPAAWLYVANQSASPGDMTEFKRQAWVDTSSLTSQLQASGTPGYTVLFQPSRNNLGAIEWMQQNEDRLVWIYQVESPAGKPKHPNGTDVWNSLYPHEWRKSRITLPTP